MPDVPCSARWWHSNPQRAHPRGHSPPVSSPCRTAGLHSGSHSNSSLAAQAEGRLCSCPDLTDVGNPTGSLALSSFAFSSILKSSSPKPLQGWAIRDWPGKQVCLDPYVLLSLAGCNYTVVCGCLGCVKRMNAWQQEVKRGEGAQDGGVNGFIHKAAAGAGCVSTAWILFCKPCAQPFLTQHGRWIKQAILKLFPSAEIAKGWQPDSLQITKSIFCTGKQGFNLSGI